MKNPATDRTARWSNAYMARRALITSVGFTLSPVLWRQNCRRPSAGRVQSVA